MTVHHDDDDLDEGTLDDLDTPAPAPTTPYAQAAHRYLAAGWRGVLPLPVREKWAPPTGYTGELGAWTSGADVQAWIDGGLPGGAPAGNVALRVPPDVIGFDVDAYDGKTGATTWAVHLARLGALPDTWVSSSRTADGDNASGIRLYRLPVVDGQQATAAGWPGVLGPGVELIRTGHRYMVVAPSVHPNGGVYRWTRPDGTPTLEVPTVEQLPLLPLPWLQHLASQARVSPGKAGLGPDDAVRWLADRQTHTQPGQPPCRLLAGYLRHKAPDLTGATGGSRHDAMLAATSRLAHAAAEGHTGVLAALADVRATFTAAAGADGHRDVTGEWNRAVLGAVQIAAHGAPTDPVTVDPCDVREDPLAGLIPSPPQEQPSWDGPPTTTSPTKSTSEHTTSTLAPATSAETAPPVSSASSSPETDSPPDPDAPDRTSWWPVDPTGFLDLDPDQANPPPQQLHRTDGIPLLYAGKTNALLGESESGKSWVAQHACVQALQRGDLVLFYDFEDNAVSVYGRLQALGATRDQLARFRYVGPEETLTVAAGHDIADQLAGRPDLVVVDGVNAAMTLLGLDLNSNTDATRFHQTLLKPLTASGACVLTIDHLPKNSGSSETKGGIGAQAKRAMVSGAAIRVEKLHELGKGRDGLLKLTVDKDRPGHVRGAADNGTTIALVKVASTDDGVEVTVSPDDGQDHGKSGPGWRPTVLMDRVVQTLTRHPDGLSGRGVNEATTGKASTVRTALEVLVADGVVLATPDAKGVVYTLADLTETPTASRVPTASHRVPGRGDSVPRPASPPTRGDAVADAVTTGPGHDRDRDSIHTEHGLIDPHTGELVAMGLL